MSEKNIPHFALALAVPSLVGILGMILLPPHLSHPSLGYTILALSILGANLFLLTRFFEKLHFSLFSGVLIFSYILLSFSFITTTKGGQMPFLFVLFSFLNLHLIFPQLEKSFIPRYFWGVSEFIEQKMAGIFGFWKYFIPASLETEPKNSFLRTVTAFGPALGIFLITGLPLILIIFGLLSSANSNFADIVHDIFNFSFRSFFHYLLVFLFLFLYLISELFFVIHAQKKSEELEQKGNPLSEESQKKWIHASLITILGLNIFYAVFVFAEMGYDLGNVADLVEKKGYDSYSELAVNRFWELIIVCVLNLSFLFFLIQPFKDRQYSLFFSRLLSANIVFLFLSTVFLIFSSFQRLNLYINAYGFTDSRFLGYSFLPFLLIITVLSFSSLFVQNYHKYFQMAFGVFIFFCALFIAIPTDSLTNAINYQRAQSGEITVYDSLYALQGSDDKFLIYPTLLKSSRVSESEKLQLQAHLPAFTKENDWREFHWVYSRIAN
ncbi:MAG: DUF4153 domain-containing protein [Candidatus Peregrinibacteria bacterium]